MAQSRSLHSGVTGCTSDELRAVAGSKERSDKKREKPRVKDLNDHIVCPLCRGYLIDATTLVECLHSFCRGCIVRRLKNGPKNCPVCNAIAQGPLTPDVGLQKLVYLMVPSLLKTELERRRHFRQVNPQCSNLNQPPIGAPELCSDELVSLSLSDLDSEGEGTTRYLQCPTGVTVRHLTRLLMLKRGWDDIDGKGQPSGNSKIEVMYEVKGPRSKVELEVLNPSWTLMDLSCIFEWKKKAPMKLLYRICRIVEPTLSKPSSITNTTTNNVNSSNQVIENIQRPPTPPPSPKPAIRTSISTPTMVTEQYSNSKDFELKKPRCEVTPVMRAPDLYPSETRLKPSKLAKLEHQHKRKKRKNKVIAEITTTPTEDQLKMKVRLTPCPPKITSSTIDEDKIKDKMSKKDKTKSSHKHKTKSHKSSPRSDEDRNYTHKSEIAKKVETVHVPEKVVSNASEPENISNATTSVKSKELEVQEAPKNLEVLRNLGLIAVSEANKARKEQTQSPQSNSDKNDPSVEREKLEKQLRESKANRVRSLLAEKQMRDTLKSIMSTSKETNATVSSSSSASTARSQTPNPNNQKRKDPPALTPLRPSKRSNVTFAPNAFMIRNKYESAPLDLSSPSNVAKEKVLDLSSSVPEVTSSKGKADDRPVGILRNKLAEKSKVEGKKPESNLRILSDTMVSLNSTLSVPLVDVSKLSHNFFGVSGLDPNRTAAKVALKIPQPHQRYTGFGLKIKPNLGVRQIPNPSAVVASQYRNQRTGFYNLVHQPP